jgi:hypothetical protein
MPPRVWCDCTARCNGGKYIAQRTWRRHAKFRHGLRATFNDFQAQAGENDDLNIDLSDSDSEFEEDGESSPGSHQDDVELAVDEDDPGGLYEDLDLELHHNVEQGLEIEVCITFVLTMPTAHLLAARARIQPDLRL